MCRRQPPSRWSQMQSAPVAAEWPLRSEPRLKPHRGESEMSCASSANLFAFTCCPPRAGVDWSTVLTELDVEHRLVGAQREVSGNLGCHRLRTVARSATNHDSHRLSSQHELADIH